MFKALWAFRRISKGKSFGNELADSLCISRNLFHTACEMGGMPMHLAVLTSLKDEGKSVIEAREIFLPILSNGFAVLEGKFGRQDELDEAKRIIDDFLSDLDQ